VTSIFHALVARSKPITRTIRSIISKIKAKVEYDCQSLRLF